MHALWFNFPLRRRERSSKTAPHPEWEKPGCQRVRGPGISIPSYFKSATGHQRLSLRPHMMQEIAEKHQDNRMPSACYGWLGSI